MNFTELKRVEEVSRIINSLQSLKLIEEPSHSIWDSQTRTLYFEIFCVKPNHSIELAREMFAVIDREAEFSEHGLRLNVTIHI